MVSAFGDLTAKIDAGERLSDQDIAALGSTRDIISLGMLATTVRRRLHGNEVTYVRVADLKLSTTADGATATDGATTTDGATADEATIDVMPTFSSAADAGEVRIFQTPHALEAAVAIVETAREMAGDT